MERDKSFVFYFPGIEICRQIFNFSLVRVVEKVCFYSYAIFSSDKYVYVFKILDPKFDLLFKCFSYLLVKC